MLRLDTVVEGDEVAVEVDEGKGAPERPVDRRGRDGVAIRHEGVVDVLHVGCVQPDRCADAGLRDGIEIGSGYKVSKCEGDGLGVEHHRVRGPGRGLDEAEVALVERRAAARSRTWSEMKSGPVTAMMPLSM